MIQHFTDCWKKAAVAIASGARRLLFHGPSGTGKTHATLKQGLRPDQKALSITCDGDLQVANVIGQYMPDGKGGAIYHYSPPIVAFRDGLRLGIQEIHKAVGSDGFAHLNALLDDPDLASITIPNGETVIAGDGFTVIATMNGDPEQLPSDILDRFPAKILIDAPHPGAIARLSDDLQQVANNTAVCEDEQRRVSIRAWLEFDRARKELSTLNQSDPNFLEGVDPEVAAAQMVFDHRWEEVYSALKLARA